MKTEELNEYIFAELVDVRAFRKYERDTARLVAQGLSEEEINQRLRPKKEYIKDALTSLTAAKKIVFELLQESNQWS